MSPPPNTGLEALFAACWASFLDGVGIDAFDLEKLLERCPDLAQWRQATEEDVRNSDLDLDVGDPLLCLTEEGERIVRAARSP